MESRALVTLLVTFGCVIGDTVFADNADGVLTLMPSNTIYKAKGEDIVLTCQARVNKNNLITNFQWLDPRDRVIDDGYLSQNRRFHIDKMGVGGQMLTISKLADTDGGVYKCQVNYDTRTLKANSTVEIYQPITFIDAPAEQWALVKSQFKLKCQVIARPSPDIRWTRNNENLDGDDRVTIEPDGLAFRQVNDSDDGVYSCQAFTTFNGAIKQQDIHFEVVSKPAIDNKTLPIQYDVIEGEPTNVQCTATGKPRPSISWIKTASGKNLTTVTDGKLYIDKITKEDNGNFKCVATNRAGMDERTVKLNVLSKPDVIESKNATIAVGQSGSISCYVYGNPAPNVIIRKQGYALPKAQIRRRRDIESNEIPNPNETVVIKDPKGRHDVIQATLNFHRVERYMDGLYECIASNMIGGKVNEVVRNLHLTVEFKPTFEKTATTNKVVTWMQRPANLTCIAEAIPNATITWYRGTSQEPLRNDPPSVYSLINNGKESILQVTPLQPSSYGPYRCKAKNIHGEAVHHITLLEARPPNAVETVEAVDVTATTVTFRISDPASNNMPIRGYMVKYKEEGEDWNNAENHTWSLGDTYIVTNLKPLRKYTFKFAAINAVGFGQMAGELTQQMPEISVPSEPIVSNPIVRDAKYIESPYATKIELRWIIPAANGAAIEKYVVNVCPALEEPSRPEGFVVPHLDECVKRDIDYRDALSSHLIENLRSDVFYQVQLTAVNSQGAGPSSTRYFKTNVNDPEKRPDDGTSSAVIIYAVVAMLIAILVIVDIFCFFIGKTGVIHLLCRVCCGRKKKDDDKLGSLYSWRFPLPYCGNMNGECNSHGGSGSVNSEMEKVPLSEMTFVFESKDLISNGHNKKVDIEEQTPMIVDGSKKDTAVEYDVKKGTSKTAFVGKDSAV